MNTISVAQPLFRSEIRRAGSVFGRAVAAVWARWRMAARERATRRYLEEMDDHMLNDLGVSRAQVLFEFDRGDGYR